MKKLTLLITLCAFVIGSVQSQELVSKKGEPYLPEEGDWALGIDVTPFFEYVGNIANGNPDNQSPSFEYAYPLQVFGKWFRSDDLAWRGRIRFLGINNRTDVGYVNDDLNTDPNDPYKQVEDVRKVSSMSTTLAFGMEKRKGNTRLQGFWGGEAVLHFSSRSNTYTYGNSMSDTNRTPTSYNFDGNTQPQYGWRVTEVDYGSDFSIGVRPFIGVEYFLFPKMSLGGEFGYSINFGSSQPTETTSEYYDQVNGKVSTTTQTSGQFYKNQFMMDNDNLSGSIKLMFHF